MDEVTLILLGVIFSQFVYLFYKEWLNSSERDKLQLKLMARDITDYKVATEPAAKEVKEEEEDSYIPIEEATVEQVLKSKEKL